MPIRETEGPQVIQQWKGVNQRLQPTLVPDGFFSIAYGVYFGLGNNAERIGGKVTSGKLTEAVFNIHVLNDIAILQLRSSTVTVPLSDLLLKTVAY